MTDNFPRWPVNYHDADTGEWIQQEEANTPPPVRIGDGVILSSMRYRRYRVVDVWHSDDRRGRFDVGTNVFLVDVTQTEEDRPYAIAPAYYNGEGEEPPAP